MPPHLGPTTSRLCSSERFSLPPLHATRLRAKPKTHRHNHRCWDAGMNFLSPAIKSPAMSYQCHSSSAQTGCAHLLAQPQHQHCSGLCSSSMNPTTWPPGITEPLSPFSRQSTSSLRNGNQSIRNSCPCLLNDLREHVPHQRNSGCTLTQRDLPQLRLPRAASGAGPPAREGQTQRSRALGACLLSPDPETLPKLKMGHRCCGDLAVAALRNSSGNGW